MKIVEDILEKIDNYFEDKKESDFYLIIFGIAFAIGFFTYNVLIPTTEEMLNRDIKRQKALESKLTEEKNYLRSVTINGDNRFLIKKLKKEISGLKRDIKNIRELNEYLDYQIKTLSKLLFNERSWSKFLYSIAEKASNYGVDIFSISNSFIQNSENFGDILEIDIECEGSYKGVIEFINSIEESELVVDIYDITLEKEKYIKANLKVSVWGINY